MRSDEDLARLQYSHRMVDAVIDEIDRLRTSGRRAKMRDLIKIKLMAVTAAA